MKVFISAIIILLLICIFIGVHNYLMTKLSADIIEHCKVVHRLAESGNWNDAYKELREIRNQWEALRWWTVLTISTNEIDNIEISLKQSMAFARLEAKPDFFGEFTRFSMYIERIPRKEGYKLEEVL